MKPKNQTETLRQHSDGKGPWDKVGTDLFDPQLLQWFITFN